MSEVETRVAGTQFTDPHDPMTKLIQVWKPGVPGRSPTISVKS
ncbi:hypothetical protein [Leptothermofonsia sichuanensis]|nr:hypothetical protein [Leptothermofonsia sichuanensis]